MDIFSFILAILYFVGCIGAITFAISLILITIETIKIKVKKQSFNWADVKNSVFGLTSKSEKTNKWYNRINVIAIISTVFFLTVQVFPDILYQEKIDALIQKDNYTAYYEADLYNDYDNVKNYDVVLEIEREAGIIEPRKAYFNKRQYITFEDNDYELLIDKKCKAESVDGREYYIKLSNIKTEMPEQ